MEKVICILGSPRLDGNSTTIAKRFIETTRGLGADIRTFELNRLNYRGCQGCCACKTKLDACALRDDLTEVLEAIKEANVIVLSTPAYMGDIPGQVKCFIDRTYSFLKPDYISNPSPSRVPPGKVALLILAQGAPGEGTSDIISRYESQMKYTMAVGKFHVIHATGVGGGGIPKDVPEHFLLQADEIGRTIMAESQQA
jgi:multimeric flavodoxin WrbA